ncbi:E3 ubiquitin-protein ligase SH3RF1 isoform X1 [Stegostoma tigrinum]|uniref:E3 ubiquitin-protein ligase SH3RF1 isoform X1 n=1 Tax=Stegostoma tigrinum TaxID=3053191 RepID=UPI00286FC15B|nr:E3 ubiquitin-protein ligase SH3RF1 isoform X1 [Stegostoma tigrinum]XP_048384150.2 E3 ubiquitin-protein ligase SH3RF1 isoform X1 [Stegostoma tigrinum]XP_048384151.2 E3 ubiquitin-protein ligase SH3RF1 isoform X1 [Stegostoma tigrinum]
MDESILLDLLECPVCLERLDATAKVLPCQHTFCRRCLQGILNSRSELRCPECRTLVDCSVDELPTNILLVRLLDGIKHRPRRPGSSGINGNNNVNGTTRVQSNGAISVPNCGTALRDLQSIHRVQARSPPVRGIPQLPCAKALYNYEGKEPGDLKFNKGDIIILRRQVDENWYHGEVNGVHGFFPTNFVQIIKPLPQPPPQCKALYDFEVKDKEADKDCLPFSKDDILTVIRRVDENWAEGVLGDKIGIFPISYVEFNSTAKHLIQLDKPSTSNSGGGDSGEGSSSTSGAVHNNSAQKSLDITKKNTKKRHSFTSLTTSNKASPSSQNRHSMEISPPVLISSSNPTAAARITELGGLSCSAPSQVHISTTGLIVTPPPSSPVNTVAPCAFPLEGTYTAPGENHPPLPPPPHSNAVVTTSASTAPRPALAPADQVAYPRPQARPNMYVALYPYTPRKEDELELRKGEIFLVLERCQDGWFKGTSMHTGKIGVFPGNYMAPVTRAPAAAGQSKLPVVVTAQVGRGVTTVVPVPAVTPLPKSPGNGVDFSRPVSPTPPIPPAVISVAHVQATNPQAKVLMHMTGQMTVNQARNAVRTAQGQERPTAAVTPIQAHSPASPSPAATVAAQQVGPSQHPQQVVSPFSVVTAPAATRPTVALTSATAAVTPPNVSATTLEGESLGIATPSATASTTNKVEKESREKKEKKGFLKLLSGASTKRKSRPSPPSSPTLESEQAASETLLQGAVGPEVPSSVSHGRTGSCPVDTEAQGTALETLHRKTASLDSGVPIAPPPRQPCSSMASVQLESKSIPCERYRVVVSYPPQSEAELELKDGDIVFVHKKREDGWFKGTLQRNGKTGLFPGSFVESI